jgi:hypothetical protein
MTLIPDPTALGPPERVYAYSVTSSAAWLALWGGLAVASLWVGARGGVQFEGGGIPPAIGYWASGCFVLAALFQWLDFRARLRPTNWLVQIYPDGLLVHLRSYRNFYFPDRGPTAALLPYAEIESVRGINVHETVPGSDRYEHTERRRRTVELKLNPVAEGRAEVTRVLDAERQPRQGWRVNHYPVRLRGDGTLDIDWEVGPPMRDFLVAIAGRVEVLPEQTANVDFTRIKGLDAANQRDMLAQLIRRGDKMSAVKLAREIYGFDRQRAVAFVDEIERRK